MTPGTLPLILTAAGSLTAMILAIHYIGVYLAMPLFLLFYMRVLGRHGLALCIATAILMPVVTFVFFELMLNIALPKGITEEPVFVPIFDWYYQQLG